MASEKICRYGSPKVPFAMWISGMPDILEREPSLPYLPSSSSPLERKTKRKKQRKDKRKIYPYYHHPSYPIPSVRLPSGNGYARSPKRETGYTRACARKEPNREWS
jgi:hypothetical protein